MGQRHSALPGTVTARWTGTARALITLDTGEVIEVDGAEEVADLFSPGDRALVYVSEEGHVDGWMLVDSEIGVNYRRGHR